MIPNVTSWIHELPLHKHTLFLEPCWVHRASLQFPECRRDLFSPLLARRCRVYAHFQMSPRVLHDFFLFFVFWIN